MHVSWFTCWSFSNLKYKNILKKAFDGSKLWVNFFFLKEIKKTLDNVMWLNIGRERMWQQVQFGTYKKKNLHFWFCWDAVSSRCWETHWDRIHFEFIILETVPPPPQCVVWPKQTLFIWLNLIPSNT